MSGGGVAPYEEGARARTQSTSVVAGSGAQLDEKALVPTPSARVSAMKNGSLKGVLRVLG
jgi:hypothetical protein